MLEILYLTRAWELRNTNARSVSRAVVRASRRTSSPGSKRSRAPFGQITDVPRDGIRRSPASASTFGLLCTGFSDGPSGPVGELLVLSGWGRFEGMGPPTRNPSPHPASTSSRVPSTTVGATLSRDRRRARGGLPAAHHQSLAPQAPEVPRTGWQQTPLHDARTRLEIWRSPPRVEAGPSLLRRGRGPLVPAGTRGPLSRGRLNV